MNARKWQETLGISDRRISDNFRENRKMFWSEVNKARKINEGISESLMDKNGRVVRGKEEVRNIFK